MRVDNSTLFLVQGTGQALNFPGMAWGNGFVTDKPTVSALGTPRSGHLAHDCGTAAGREAWSRAAVCIL